MENVYNVFFVLSTGQGIRNHSISSPMPRPSAGVRAGNVVASGSGGPPPLYVFVVPAVVVFAFMVLILGCSIRMRQKKGAKTRYTPVEAAETDLPPKPFSVPNFNATPAAPSRPGTAVAAGHAQFYQVDRLQEPGDVEAGLPPAAGGGSSNSNAFRSVGAFGTASPGGVPISGTRTAVGFSVPGSGEFSFYSPR